MVSGAGGSAYTEQSIQVVRRKLFLADAGSPEDEKNEYILFSDQDDVWENDKVSVMLHRMKVLEKGLGSACPYPAVFR